MSNSRRRNAARRPAPLSVRFSETELSELRRRAGNMPLSGYVRRAALGTGAPAVRQAPRPDIDRASLARVLALLGQSRLASHVGELARAARSGSLPVDDATAGALNTACCDIAEIRTHLLKALGVTAPEPSRQRALSGALASTFRQQASGLQSAFAGVAKSGVTNSGVAES